MRFYPAFLDIRGKWCIVVGGGEVAQRKVEPLLSAGAAVTVISPKLTKRLNQLKREGGIHHTRRGYREGDLQGAFLVISSSDSKEVNEAVYKEATGLGILINAVDDPAHCNFIVPSIVERGALTIAISTSGKSPLLAKTLRQAFENAIGREYGAFIEILGAVREKLLKKGVENDKKENVIKALINSHVPLWLREGNTREIDRFLQGLLGKGNTLSRLGVKPPKDAADKK